MSLARRARTSVSEPHVLVLLRRLLQRPGAVHGENIVGSCEQAALRAARGLAGNNGSVTVCTVGRARREEKALQLALGRYADRAIRVSDSGADRLDYLGIARALHAVVKRFDAPLHAVVCGDRSEDGLSGAVGPALAELLDLPHLSGIVDLEFGDSVVATTRSGGFLHRFRIDMPAVLCVRECTHEVADSTSESPPTAVETLTFRDLELGTEILVPRTRLDGSMSAVRTGVNATIAANPAELVALLTADHLLP